MPVPASSRSIAADGERDPPNMQIRNESSTTGLPTVRFPTSIIIVEIRPP